MLLCVSTLRQPSWAMKVNVHLPSRDGCSVEVSPSTLISELKAAAQQHFQRRLKLIAEGRQLDLTATLDEAGLQDWDVVTTVVQLRKLARTQKAFAFHGNRGELLTWGDPQRGADSSQAQEQLRNVRHILESGTVVTWGQPEYGGASSIVQEQLRNVQHIQATNFAFAAILGCCDLG